MATVVLDFPAQRLWWTGREAAESEKLEGDFSAKGWGNDRSAIRQKSRLFAMKNLDGRMGLCPAWEVGCFVTTWQSRARSGARGRPRGAVSWDYKQAWPEHWCWAIFEALLPSELLRCLLSIASCATTWTAREAPLCGRVKLTMR